MDTINYSSTTHVEKEKVREKILYYCRGIRGNALVLGGPMIDRYIENILPFTRGPYKIHSWESNVDTFSQQCSLLPKPHPKVILHYGNVSRAKAESFIDLDLMGTLQTQSGTIEKLFKKQLSLKSGTIRTFIFTLCTRNPEGGSSIESILSFLGILLSTRVEILSVVEHEYILRYSSSKFVIRMFTYKDGAPMLACLIQY